VRCGVCQEEITIGTKFCSKTSVGKKPLGRLNRRWENADKFNSKKQDGWKGVDRINLP
jgi:hypothetical protein